MSEPGPAKSFIEILKEVAEGGLLRLFASKPVQQAVGRLVSGVVDVPTAYLEGWAQSIRSDTIARKQLTSAVAAEAQAMIACNTDLSARALERYTRKFAARQRSVDEVALRTIQVLSGQELPPDAAAPSEDFMRMFEDTAERASSEEVSDLMARILAGEIRKPKSVSLKTLQVVAVLDREIVQALLDVAPYRLYYDWFHIPPSEDVAWRRHFRLLATANITNEAGVRSLRFDTTNKCAQVVGGKMIVLTSKPSLGGVWHVDGANLTPIGVELLSILPTSFDTKFHEVALGFKKYSFITKVEIGDVIKTDGGMRTENEVEI